MISENFNTSFLAKSQSKFLHIGFLISISLAIAAFHFPMYAEVKNDLIYEVKDEESIELISYQRINTELKKVPTPVKQELPPVVQNIVPDPDPVPNLPIVTDVPPEDLPPEVIPVEKPVSDKPLDWAPQMPQYASGDVALVKYLKGVKYCDQAIRDGAEGRVLVAFTVSKKGEVKDVEVVEGVHPCLDKAAKEQIENMSDWLPGKQGLSNVAVRMVLPFSFILND